MTRRRRTAARRALGILAVAAALVVSDLGARVLATNDEARFPLLAQDILTRGDWLHPMVNGSSYYNKPPLQAWLIAAASWPAGGVTQLTAALPSAAAAVAAALLVWQLGRTLFGTDAGRAAALAFMTMQGVFLHARLPLPDMLLTALITASLWVCTIALRRQGPWWWLAFYALAGAAFWAKGPAGLLPLAVAVVVGVLRFRRGWWSRTALVPGLAIVVAVTAPWWILGITSDRSAFGHAIVVDELRWYLPGLPGLASVTGPFQNVVSVVFPWVTILPLVVAQALRAVRGRGSERDHVAFLLVWALVTVVAVGLSREQRLRYYLPLAPPMALLIGWWYSGAVVKRRTEQPVNWPLVFRAVVGLAVLTLAVSATRPRWRQDLRLLFPGSAGEMLFLLVAFGLMLSALALGIRFRRLAPGFSAAWITAALLLGGGYHWALARRNAAYDYPRISSSARPMLDAEVSEFRAWGTPALPLAFYLGRSVTSVEAHLPLPALQPEHGSTIALVRASLLQRDPSGTLTVLSREQLGGEAVAVIRQEQRAPVDIRTP